MSTVTHEILTKASGICSVCKHQAECIYPKTEGHIALNCGQFEQYPPVAPLRPAKDVAELERLWKQPTKPKDVAQLKGLCASCEDRDVCIYPKRPGGVWQCEEYR